jgi:hypothetical protein
MKTCVLLLMLQLSVINPFSTFQITDIKTADAGVVQLNQDFPDWYENYRENEFDCSEMSALANQYFKCAGIKSEVKTGYRNEPRWFAHAWVSVEGKNLEATNLTMVYDSFGYDELKSYGTPDLRNDTEYDWWNSKYIKNKLNEIPIKDKESIIKSQMVVNGDAWSSASDKDKIALHEANMAMQKLINGEVIN